MWSAGSPREKPAPLPTGRRDGGRPCHVESDATLIPICGHSEGVMAGGLIEARETCGDGEACFCFLGLKSNIGKM